MLPTSNKPSTDVVLPQREARVPSVLPRQMATSPYRVGRSVLGCEDHSLDHTQRVFAMADMEIVQMITAERGTYLEDKNSKKRVGLIVMWLLVTGNNIDRIIGATPDDMIGLAKHPDIALKTMFERVYDCEYVTAAGR